MIVCDLCGSSSEVEKVRVMIHKAAHEVWMTSKMAEEILSVSKDMCRYCAERCKYRVTKLLEKQEALEAKEGQS